MTKLYFRRATLFLLATVCVSNVAQAAGPQRVCGRYSTILLSPDETAEVIGVGRDSVSLLIKGSLGPWIFYDGLVSPDEKMTNDTKVYTSKGSVAYRRNHDARIYVVRPVRNTLVAGKRVQVGIMGVDFMRQPLANSAIVGTDSDLPILKRILPGTIGTCDLRWVPVKGLVK